MFTGLIAELGKVEELRREQNSYRLTIAAQTIPPLLKIGESVCCNGACLTVTKFDSQRFTVDVMPETARRTTIGSLKKGDRINLERTLHVGGRTGRPYCQRPCGRGRDHCEDPS